MGIKQKASKTHSPVNFCLTYDCTNGVGEVLTAREVVNAWPISSSEVA